MMTWLKGEYVMCRQNDPSIFPDKEPGNAESPIEVTRTAKVYRPSWMDRLFLIGREILESYYITPNIVILICVGVGVGRWRRPKARRVILKCSYSGNRQYYILKYEELDTFIMHLVEAKHKLEEIGT